MDKSFKSSTQLPPSADGPQAYDEFWSAFVESQSEEWLREVTETIVKNLPAQWLQDIADIGDKVLNEMHIVDEDQLEFCKTHALVRLLEAYINCSQDRQAFKHGCSSRVAAEVFKRCIEAKARE